MSVIWSPATTNMSTTELSRLRHPHSSGLIFFAYNYESPSQMKNLIDSVREVNPNIIISVDQEGGRVQRFVKGMSKLPTASKLGELYTEDIEKGVAAAYSIGRLCGTELAELGINVNYAPVLDVNHGISKVIGTRSYSDDVDVIVAVATAYIDGMQDAGVVAVGKHFPGHGGVADDSHHNLPYDVRDIEAITTDSMPFARMSSGSSPKLRAIMTSHIVFPAVDDLAVTFSKTWLERKLRQEMDFQGVIFGDDLSMGAAKSLYKDSATGTAAMLNAGCDFALVCNDVDEAARAMDKLEEMSHPEATTKLDYMLRGGSTNSTCQIDQGVEDTYNLTNWDIEEARHLCNLLNQD